MNTTSTPRWSPMVSGPDDDFAGFLDFGDINFSAFGDGTGAGAGPDAVAAQHGIDSVSAAPISQVTSVVGNGDGGAMDLSIDDAASPAGLMGPHASIQQQQRQQQQQQALANSMVAFQEGYTGLGGSPAPFMSRQHSQQHERILQQQQQHQQQQALRYYPQPIVPPTPNSFEMHGAPQEYYTPADRQQQLMYEHYRRQQEEQMNFTPLVSPAVTPLDTQFQHPDYASLTDGFSPLTSPALRAQNHSTHHSVYGAVRSDTSDTTSPIDPQLEYTAPTSGQTPSVARKSKRKTSISSGKTPLRGVRQSPVVKPHHHRRRQTSSTVIPPKEVERVLGQARNGNVNESPTSGGLMDPRLPLPYAQDSSGPDSVSPEPLSEILMPPPATPKASVTPSKSPYLMAKNGKGVQSQSQQPSPGIKAKEAPATPASLMKIRKGQNGKMATMERTSSILREQPLAADADMEQIMEDIVLPEPASMTTPNASRRPSLQPINITTANGVEKTNTSASASATATPAKTPTITSAPATATSSAFPSPITSALQSPNGAGAAAGGHGKRAIAAGGATKSKVRDVKKRTTSSTQISPALRPKISPSIKPLLPEGGGVVSAETSALLLASKSNYQNILEGTHLPGVSYPETLSTNLTSKRTSHKIAEQGRRNRINNALQEIASLLPVPEPSPIMAASSASPHDGAVVNGSGGANGTTTNGITNGSVSTSTTSTNIPTSSTVSTSTISGPQEGVIMTASASAAAAAAAQQGNSKASTVEMAIDYIKRLQQENREKDEEIERLRGLVGEVEAQTEEVGKNTAL